MNLLDFFNVYAACERFNLVEEKEIVREIVKELLKSTKETLNSKDEENCEKDCKEQEKTI